MKFLIIILIVITSAARADVVTVSTEGTSVAFTNDQSNFVWSPTALIYSRDQADPVSLHIYRYGNGTPVLLASITATASNGKLAPGLTASARITARGPRSRHTPLPVCAKPLFHRSI